MLDVLHNMSPRTRRRTVKGVVLVVVAAVLAGVLSLGVQKVRTAASRSSDL